MKWIKLSERLPTNNTYEIVCKTSLGVKEICDFENDKWEGDLRGTSENPEVIIEWLDESPETITSTVDALEDYPTHEQAGGDKPWDEMTELEKAYYNLRKLYDANAIAINTIKSIRAGANTSQHAGDVSVLKGALETITCMEPYLGRAGCKYGDTDYDSLSVGFGETIALNRASEIARIALAQYPATKTPPGIVEQLRQSDPYDNENTKSRNVWKKCCDTLATILLVGDKGEDKKATNIPDGEGDWVIGQETYSRQEVFKMLHTQRAMISNDVKRTGAYEKLPEIVARILENPRPPLI